MRLSKSITAAAFGLALGLAAEAQAGLITLPAQGQSGPFGPSWNHQGYALSSHVAWGSRRIAPKPSPWNRGLAALLKEHALRTQSPLGNGFRFGTLDLDPPKPHHIVKEDFCEVPDPENPPDDEIADNLPDDRLPQPNHPAVPEPDTLAMLGAGLLGLVAARAMARRR